MGLETQFFIREFAVENQGEKNGLPTAESNFSHLRKSVGQRWGFFFRKKAGNKVVSIVCVTAAERQEPLPHIGETGPTGSRVCCSFKSGRGRSLAAQTRLGGQNEKNQRHLGVPQDLIQSDRIGSNDANQEVVHSGQQSIFLSTDFSRHM